MPKLFLLVGSYVFAGRKLNPFPGANAHFNELRHGSHTVCHHRYLDHGVSLQGARRSLAEPHTNDHPAGLLELGVQIVSGVLAGEHVHMIVVFGNLKVASTNYRSQVLGPGELRGLQALEEVGLRPALFLNACLRRARAMGDVRRRADFVGERR